MRYRIEVSQTRKGFIRVNFPGRVLALEAVEHEGPLWQVDIKDQAGDREGRVAVRAGNAGDAVWRVAQATVRAVAELTDSPLDDDSKADNATSTNLP